MKGRETRQLGNWVRDETSPEIWQLQARLGGPREMAGND